MSKSYILGIDPSNKASAYCLIDLYTLRPVEFGFLPKEEMLCYVERRVCDGDTIYLAVEGMQNQGHSVGKDVFNTAYIIGMILERASATCLLHGGWGWYGTYELGNTYEDVKLIYRSEEKKNLCGKVARIKDKDIRRALINRFAEFDFNNGKGTKKEQDWFFGFARDIWSAYAVAITYYDLYL